MTGPVPYVSNFAYVPKAYLGNGRLARVKQALTIRPRVFDKETPKIIPFYTEAVDGYLGCPIDWALNHFPELGFEDRTVIGADCYYNKLPDPHHPSAAPGQAQFMADLDAAAASFYTLSARAPTGAGKTIVALRTAALRGRRTLIVLHRQRLARQWAHAIYDHLGVPYDDIGWVQGDVCNYDHPFVIAVSSTLVLRKYPAAFYESFGTVIYDELHRVGSAFFSQTVGLFPAQCMIGLTATDKRKDGADKVFHYYFGDPPKVIVEQPAMGATVHVLRYRGRVPTWATKPGHIASLLAKDPARNGIILVVIKKLYEAGRQALFIGASVEHLQHLMRLAEGAGIPARAMGLFVDQRYTGETRKSYAKPKTLARRDRVVYWLPEAEHDALFPQHTEVQVTEVLGGDCYKIVGPGKEGVAHISELRNKGVDKLATKRVSHDELDAIAERSQLIFASYGIFREGTDIPRLDAGMDVTPQSEGVQVIGRIRRPFPGKLTPVWYTFGAEGHPVIDRMWLARRRAYERSNCVVRET